MLTVAIQWTCVEFGGQSLKTVPLTFDEHLLCFGLGSIPIFASPIFKLLVPTSIFNFLSVNEKPVEE